MAKKNRQKSFAHSASSASSQLSQLHKSPSSNTVNSTTTPAGQSSPGDSHDSPSPHSSLTSASSSHQPPSQPKSLYHWIHSEREGLFWILGCAFVGALLGFGVGCGWFTGGSGTYQMVLKTTARSGAKNVAKSYEQEYVVTEWRMALAERIRKTAFYEVGTFRRNPWNVLFSERGEGGVGKKGGVSGGNGGMSGGNSADDDYWASFTRGDGSETKTVTAPLPSLIPGEIQEYAHSPQARDAYKRNIVKGKNRNESTSHSIQPSRTFLRNFWPQNWSLFSNLDADRGDTSDGALSPLMVSFFSFILPWKRRTIQALARKDSRINNDEDNSFYYADPYFHPLAFAVLREHVVRFEKGYVHPDLGFLVPAPSGASRGLGMVRDSYNKCQVQCYPGSAEEAKSRDRKEQNKNMQQNQTVTYEQIQATLQRQSTATTQQYTQLDILLHIPLEAQITRSTALRILTPLLPKGNVNLANSINELDDGPLLALLLAHERALGSDSRFYPYIATLPLHPSCGWNPEWRQSVVDVVTAMSVQMGTDVQGWPAEIAKAADMADRISRALGRDYGSYLAARQDGGGGDVTESIRWSLCQVSSRAIAGRESYGSLRLVPILDMVNHDAEAGKFVELTGEESLEKGDFLDAEEDDAGAFVLRSRRHGRKKALRRGQELLANYNVPFYSPLDWFLNMGYIPPERAGKWTMIDAGLPRTQRGGFSRSDNIDLNAQSGAFGSGKPEVQVIQNRHSQEITQQSVGGECDSNQHGTCQR